MRTLALGVTGRLSQSTQIEEAYAEIQACGRMHLIPGLMSLDDTTHGQVAETIGDDLIYCANETSQAAAAGLVSQADEEIDPEKW